ncbi:MAG: phospholipid carrier-dependent glycosyltransferase [Chloroflexota bacterium]
MVFVAAIAALVLRGPAVDQGFTIDESRWIATSRYFWITFVDRDLLGPAWQPNYIVLTHPPVARYVIGLGLWVQGWTPGQLNGRYDSLESRAYNVRAGNIPEAELLAAARRVVFPFAVAGVCLVYGIGRTLGGRLAGLCAAALTLVNPLLTTVWTRALAESIVATFTLLTLLLALQVMPWVGQRTRLAWVPMIIGATLALATATKLNGAMGAVGLGVFGAIQQGLAFIRTRRTAGLRSWVDIALSAIIVFVAVNPLLYVNPAQRAVALLQHRQDEMDFQRMVFSDQAVPEDLGARIARVARRTFDTWATPAGPLPVSPDVVLAPVGVLLLVRRAVRHLRLQIAGPPLLFLCWTGVTYAIVTTNLGFDSSHYFAPIAALNMVLAGYGAAWLVNGSGQVARRRIRDRQYTQAPTT